MCLLCVEWQAGRMNRMEMIKAMTETLRVDGMSDDEFEHLVELYRKMRDGERSEEDTSS